MDNNKTTEQFLKEIDQLKVKIGELENNSELFQLIAENTSDNIGITTFDLKAKYIYVSPSVKSILGYDPEDLLGKSFFDFIHPEDKKALFSLLKKYISLKVKNLLTGKDLPISETIEFRFKNKAGNWRFMRSTVNIAGKQLLAVTRDITEIKQAEEALRESEERLRLLFDNSPVGVSITDLKGYFIEVNPALCNMTGYSRNEMTGKHFNTFSHPDDYEKNRKLFEKLVEGKIKYFDIEKRYIHKNENIVNVLIRAQLIRDKKGNPLFLTAIIEDVTERKKASEILKESEQKLRNIFENSTNLFYSHTPDHILTYLSPQVEDILGYTREEAMIKWTELISDNPGNEIGFKNTVKAINTGKRQPTYELELVKKSGEKIWVEVREFPQVENGKTIAIIGSIVEITKRKMTEQELIRANAEVKESELKYKKFSDATVEGIIFHENGIALDVNNALLKMSGYTYDELIGQNIIQLLIVKKYHPLIAQNMAKRFTLPYEVETIKKDGTIIPVEIEGRNIRANNKIIRVVAVRDITKRKLAEETLKESEIKFREMANMLPQIVYETDINGNLTFINEQGYEFFGYSKAEFENSFNVSWSLIPGDRGRVKIDIHNAMYGKHVENSEYTALKKDGSTFPILIYANAILKDNKPVGLRGIIVDISDRKQAENTLKKKMNELEVFNDAAVDRELLVNDLRKEINELLEKSGVEPKYTIVE